MGRNPARKVIGIVLLSCLAIAVSGIRDVSADYYKYYDKKGTPSFTNDYNAIPEQYRKSAILVAKDTPQPQSPAGGTPAVATETPGVGIKQGKGGLDGVMVKLNERPGLKLGLLVSGAIAVMIMGFLLIGKIASALNCRQLGTIIRLIFIIAILGYGYLKYSQKMMVMVKSMTGKAVEIQKKSDTNIKQQEELLKQ
jgi:hypothetical protein